LNLLILYTQNHGVVKDWHPSECTKYLGSPH
jgi:hypothetical protein